MIRVVVADDYPAVREGLKRIIASCPDMEVTGEAADGHEALRLCASVAPDVLVLDVAMPGPGFLEVLRRVSAEHPGTRVLVLSVHGAVDYGVRALRAGATGYLDKERSPDELVAAIRRIHAGREYLTPELAGRLGRPAAPRARGPPHERLTRREYQILIMLGSGRSVPEIAQALGVTRQTVRRHRSRILAKTGMGSDAELARYVTDNELTE